MINILLVEDDPVDARVFCLNLKDYDDVSINHVNNLEEAVGLSEDDYDFVFLDLFTKTQRGSKESLARCRQLFPKCRIIVLSGSESSNDLMTALNYNISYFITKSHHYRDLYKIIKSVYSSGVNTNVCSLSINDDMKIISCDKEVEDIFGYCHGELINKDIKILVHKDARSDHDSYVRSFSGMPRNFYLCRLLKGEKKDGSTVALFINLSKSGGIFTARIDLEYSALSRNNRSIEKLLQLENKICG